MRLRRLAGLLVLALGVVACSPGSGSGGELEGTTWVLRSYANGGTLEIVPDSLYADAHFTRTRVEGFGGCNEYNGLARASGRQLRISQVATTFMACADLAMTFESTYLTVLHDSRFYGIRAGTLTIAGADGQAILVFDAAPKNPLLGSWVVDSFARPLPGTTGGADQRNRIDRRVRDRERRRIGRLQPVRRDLRDATATSCGSAGSPRPAWLAPTT